MTQIIKNLTVVLIPSIAVISLVAFKAQDLSPVILLLDIVLLVIGYITALFDIREKRIPNKAVLALLVSWVIVMVPQFILHRETAVQLLIYGGVGFLLNGALLLLVYYISRKALGGGDVKLMTVAGLFLGPPILNAMLYGSVLAAIVSVILILTKKMNKKDSIPLIPFLYVGIVATMFLQ